jgi:hypothetical protein
MTPHPVTWQHAREGERQDVLAAAERDRRETRGAMMASRPGAPLAPSPGPVAAIQRTSLVHYTTRVGSLRLLNRLVAMLT